MVRSLKALILSLAFGAGTMALVGCGNTTVTGTPPSGKNPTDLMKEKLPDAAKGIKEGVDKAVEKAKEGTDKAVEKAKEVGADAKKGAEELLAKAKETFTKPLTEMLGLAEKDVAKYKEDAKTAKDDAKKALLEKADKATALIAKIKEKVAAIATAPGDKWEALKAEVEKLVTELKTYLPGK